jgi:DNA-binding NarL/FixJ family response regulator
MLRPEKRSSGASDDSPDRSGLCQLVLASPFPILLDGLQSRFKSEPGFGVVSCCTNGAQALGAVLTHRPDVFILDMQIAEKSAFEVLEELSVQRTETRVILLADRVSGDEMLEATQLGVKGIVLTSMPADLFVVCVRKVHAGDTWFERASTGRAFDRLLRRKREQESDSRLTPRQLEIIRLVAAGHSNKEIAGRLAISEGTVKSHLHTLFDRLGVRGRVELILHAQKLDLFDPPGDSSTRTRKAS